MKILTFASMAFFSAAIACGVLSAQPKKAETPDSPGEKIKLDKAAKKMPEHPYAPEEFRRPKGYKPTLYKLNLSRIAQEYSAQTIERGRNAYKKLCETNANGKWKATPESIDSHKCPEWFVDAKFGIFIDWGLWSIPSWAPKREKGAMYPDWYEKRMYSNFDAKSPFWGYRNYHIKNWGADFESDHFIPLFKAEKFDAKKLVGLFKDSGAKYVVPFNKHHSGFCLWDCSYTLRDTVDMAAKRDIVKEIVDECSANGLKFGFYFSLTEWEYPILGDDGTVSGNFSWGKMYPYTPDMEFKASGKIAVKDYVKEYLIPQTMEFIEKYSPDILWYDGEWKVPAAELGSYDLSAYFYNINEGKKEVAVNDRYGEGTEAEVAHKKGKRLNKILRAVRGDFFTDEFGDTADSIDTSKYHPWESCRGISQSYGNNWQDDDTNVLSSKELISMFAGIVARGGNLLLLVNLDGQGAIPEVQKRRLLDMGKWLEAYGEAIYGTRIVRPFDTKEAAYTRSKDGKFVYAVIKEAKPEIVLEVLPVSGSDIRELAGNAKIEWKKNKDGNSVTLAIPDGLAKRDLPFAVKIRVE